MKEAHRSGKQPSGAFRSPSGSSPCTRLRRSRPHAAPTPQPPHKQTTGCAASHLLLFERRLISFVASVEAGSPSSVIFIPGTASAGGSRTYA